MIKADPEVLAKTNDFMRRMKASSNYQNYVKLSNEYDNLEHPKEFSRAEYIASKGCHSMLDDDLYKESFYEDGGETE